MFPQVRAEMAKRKITLSMLAEDPRVNCTVSTLSQKLNGKYPLTFREAVGIKAVLGTNLSLEELFSEEGTEAVVC